MPDKKITDLDPATSLDLTDLVPSVIDPEGSPVTKKLTLEQIRNLLDADGIYHRLDDTPHASDDEFDGVTMAPDWIQVLGTGYTAPQFTLGKSSLNMRRAGATGVDTDSNLCAYLKTISGSAGSCTIETAVRALVKDTNNSMLGLTMANGTDPTTSKVVAVGLQFTSSKTKLVTYTGTLDALTRNSLQLFDGMPNDRIFIRLNWSATNTFIPTFSPNGVVWDALELPSLSYTMTPTHFGIAYGWRTATEPIFSWEYFRKVA